MLLQVGWHPLSILPSTAKCAFFCFPHALVHDQRSTREPPRPWQKSCVAAEIRLLLTLHLRICAGPHTQIQESWELFPVTTIVLKRTSGSLSLARRKMQEANPHLTGQAAQKMAALRSASHQQPKHCGCSKAMLWLPVSSLTFLSAGCQPLAIGTLRRLWRETRSNHSGCEANPGEQGE